MLFRSPQAFFQPLLRHPSPSIALTVIKLLAANPKTSFRALLEEAQAHHEPRIRATALIGLWKLGDPSLVEQTSSQTCSKTLELYIRALGFTGPDPTVQSLLESLSINSNIAIRYAAYLSLGKVGRKDQVPEILLRAVEEFSLPVCSAMIRTCLKLNEDETIRTLLNLFELYSEAKDTDSIEKINYFIELTPHHAAALKIVTSLKDSRSIHESQHREGETSLDLNLIQDLVDHLQRGSHKSNLAVKNNVQSLNRFEFLELLG